MSFRFRVPVDEEVRVEDDFQPTRERLAGLGHAELDVRLPPVDLQSSEIKARIRREVEHLEGRLVELARDGRQSRPLQS